MTAKTGNARSSYTLLLCFTAYGMANLNVLMSIGAILLAVHWLAVPGFRKGWRLFVRNRPAVALAGLFVLHVVWMINTQDLDYALNDLRIKLPLLVFAVVLGGTILSRNQVMYTFGGLAVGIWVASIRAYINYFGEDTGMLDFRSMVMGISHIRLSLMMVLVVAAVVYYWQELSLTFKVLGALTILNILFFFNIIPSASGVAILVLVALYTLLHAAWNRYRAAGVAVVLSATGLLVTAAGLGLHLYYQNYFTSQDSLTDLPDYSELGSAYMHLTDVPQVENGHYTYIYIAEDELVEAWERRSTFPVRGPEHEIQRIALVRYLTSKGLRKDQSGVIALSDQDVRNVEKGYPSVVYAEKYGLGLRLHTTLFGYHQYHALGHAGGSSLFQRLVYWEAAAVLIKRHFWLGAGTGDVRQAFENIYEELDMGLAPQYRLRAHNQYLTFWVSFGIFGLLYFVGLFVLPFFAGRMSYLHVAFLLIAFVSCLTEDTLETQAGVTLFAFFYALLSVPARTLRHK